jgi:peptidyl-prolyl cis-trans isomerase D
MLNVLRDSFKRTPYLKIVLAVVAVSLVLFLGSFFVGDQSGGGGGDWVARVNGANIPEWRFREVARNLDGYYRDLFGQNYEQIKEQLQIRRQALDALIEKEVILQDAQRIGLRSSAADLAEQIRTHPSLQDASGQFIGKERYKRVLERNYPGGYAAFERILSEDLIERQWTSLITQPVTVSDDELREIFRSRTEKTAIDYVFVAAAEQKIDREIGDDEMRRWYDEHIADYMRDAGWKIRYLLVERDSWLERIEVGDDEVRSYYEANQSNYSHPEQRRARHILFRAEPGAADEDSQDPRARAEATLERLRGGEDFDALARELSDDTVSAERGGDLDFFGRGQMVEAFDAAVFDTPVGEYAPITETPFGVHVIEVTDLRPAGVTPLAEVEEDIRRLLQFRQVDAGVSSEAQRLRDEIGGAERLEEVASGEGLTVGSAFFNESEQIQDLGASPELSEVVAGLETGAISQPVRVPRGLALVVVDEILPAAPAPFEDVKASLSIAILDDLSQAAALEAARQADERHADLAAVAEALGPDKQSSGDLSPGQSPPGTGPSTPELEEILFGENAKEGNRGVVAVADGALVYEILRREPFDPGRFESEKTNLRREALADRRSQYRQSVLNQLKVQQRIEYNPLWLEELDRT